MSAFAVIYERSNTPGPTGVLNNVMERLSHRGPDGSNTLLLGAVTMGHWHFWTTPEEVDERQPVRLADSPFTIVLDGRLDNRSEIISQLEIDLAEASLFSDAVLILRAYHRWNKACFERFVGEFALVIFDKDKNELVCARDHLGDRTLFFASTDTHFVIASEPWAVLAADGLKPELNRNTVAHFFALQVPEDGQTFFTGVSELLPAHQMTVDASGHTIARYWQPDLTRKLRFKTEKEYADHFLALLDESVRCRMRSITPVGVSMSGGLDSTSVACLAARMQSPQPLTTISNVYDELLECDEREYIDTVKAQYGIRSIRIPSDDAWTYKGWQSRLHNPNQPEGNLYRINKERIYQTAHNVGLRVVFTGGSGDRLYIAGREWLTDLLREGRFRDALAGLALQIRSRGIRYTLSFGHVRITLQSFWQKFLPGLLSARKQKVVYPAWLHTSLTGFLKKDRSWLPQGLERYATLLGLMSAYGCSRETFIASRYELELRHPYRDRRLVEFMIGIPAYMLYRDGFYKHILRVAMQGILPEAIRTRKRATFLSPLFLRGIEREKAVLYSNLYEDDRAWLQFVDARWVRKHLSVRRSSNKPGIALFVAWLCVSFEAWYGTFTQANEISGGSCDSRA